MTAAPTVRWHAPDLPACRWASWEPGEYFLFNPASGKTHLLNETGRGLLLLLGDCPRSVVELGELLYDESEPVSPAQLQRLVADQIRQLTLIGLTEVAP